MGNFMARNLGGSSDISFQDKPLTDEVGVVYIVTNDYRDDEDMQTLRACEVDLIRMKKFFNSLVDKYYVVTAQNRNREDFVRTLIYLATWPNYPVCCRRIIVYFSGHGRNGYITMEKNANKRTNITINDILLQFRTEICRRMVKIILLDACCTAEEVICERGYNELVACAASKGHTSQSDPFIGGYWSNDLCLMLESEQDCDFVTVLELVKEKMEKKSYPLYNQNKELHGTTNLSPSFKSGLLETEKIYFEKKGMSRISV